MKFNDKYKIRTRQLAIRTLHWSASLPEFKQKPTGLVVVEKQLVRAVTSVAANFRAFCRGRSEKECFAKLCIVVEENDEALFWMDLLIESKLVKNEVLYQLYQEAEELLRVFQTLKNKKSGGSEGNE